MKSSLIRTVGTTRLPISEGGDCFTEVKIVAILLSVPDSLCDHELHDPLGDVRLVAPSDPCGRDREDLGGDVIGLSYLVPDLATV